MFASVLIALSLTATNPAPISFRCDQMEVSQNPPQSRCVGNAIVRQNDILICCDSFVTKASQSWKWQSLECVGNVRASRQGEWTWANKANFNLKSQVLTLRGKPLLRRGKSLLAGQAITIESGTNKARVIQPSGVMHHSLEPRPALSLSNNSELPKICPLPERPKDNLR